MKKLHALLLSALMIFVFVLAGCGGNPDLYADSEYLGTWTATTAEYSGFTIPIDDLMDGFSFTLEADGSASATIDGDTGKGDWEPTDDGILLKDSTGEMSFTGADGNLVIEYSGAVLTFEKQ